MQSEIEKTAMNKIIKARSHLLFDNPFIGSQAIKYGLIPTNKTPNGIEIKTAAINGKDIFFNPEYVNSLSFNQVKFLLAHETAHCMLKHHVRRSGRDFETWNDAGDYAINDILVSENIGQVIDGCLIDPQYSDIATEDIFRKLYQEKQEQEKNSRPDKNDQSQSSGDNSNNAKNDASQGKDNKENVPSGSNGEAKNQADTANKPKTADNPAGSVIDAPKELTKSEVESDIKESIQNALNASKRAGKMPGQKVLDAISEILAPKANWKQLLQQWIDSTDKTDVSFIRPKDRGNGYYSPGYYSEGLNQLLIAIDVSGSVLSVPKSIDTFQSEINALKQAHQFDCQVIYFHSTIERIENYQRHENITIKIEETGGTCLQSVFDYISDNGLCNQISGLIIFTDLEICDFPKHEPGFKVLFVKYGNNSYCECAPIGETITIN